MQWLCDGNSSRSNQPIRIDDLQSARQLPQTGIGQTNNMCTRLLAAILVERRSTKRDLNTAASDFISIFRIDWTPKMVDYYYQFVFAISRFRCIEKEGTQRIFATKNIIHFVRSSQFARLKMGRTKFSITFSVVINSGRWYVYTSALSRFAIHHHFSQLRARALS